MVQIDVGQTPQDVYDAVTNEVIDNNVSGEYQLQIPADNAVLLVLMPAGAALEYDLNMTLVNSV